MKPVQLQFDLAYELAYRVQETVRDGDGFEKIPWHKRHVVASLAKCSKTSILHHYIRAAIVERFDRYIDGRILSPSERFALIKFEFDTYHIEIETLDDYVSAHPKKRSTNKVFSEWYHAQRSAFERLWKRLIDEVFHLLFRDRVFLLGFDVLLADYLNGGNVCIPSEYLTRDGRLRRPSHIPVWARRAVFYRDQGRCVLCKIDLTGVYDSARRLHLDHIVPLATWGTNDPCNLQVLCEGCNLEKAGLEAVVSDRYVSFW